MQREGACVCFEPLSSGSALRAGTHNPYHVPHGRGCVCFTRAYGATEDRFHKHLNYRITHKPPLAASSRKKVPQHQSRAHICGLPSQRACHPKADLPKPSGLAPLPRSAPSVCRNLLRFAPEGITAWHVSRHTRGPPAPGPPRGRRRIPRRRRRRQPHGREERSCLADQREPPAAAP